MSYIIQGTLTGVFSYDGEVFPGNNKPVDEWIDAIKNDTLPGSNFEYSADLTEMAIVGSLAQRFATKIEYDSENMKITNNPNIDKYIKEPTREGWSFGEGLI